VAIAAAGRKSAVVVRLLGRAGYSKSDL